MNNFDAARTDGQPLQCYYCGREIKDGHWFARIKVGNLRVGLCRPRCLELFLSARSQCVGDAAQPQ